MTTIPLIPKGRIPADLLARLLVHARGSTLERVELAYLFLDWCAATVAEAAIAGDAGVLEEFRCVPDKDYVTLGLLWARWTAARVQSAALMSAEAGVG